MAFRVDTSADAEYEASVILEWLISRRAGDAGLRWFTALEQAIRSLETFPERCPVAPEAADSPVVIRQLLYGRKPHTYRILFTIEGDTVHVLHIRHGRRQHLSLPH